MTYGVGQKTVGNACLSVAISITIIPRMAAMLLMEREHGYW